MTIAQIRRRLPALALVLLLASACQSKNQDGTPDYPVTVIPPGPAATQEPTDTPSSPEPYFSPTIDWSSITLLPLRTPEASGDPQSQVFPDIPDPLTELDLDLLAPGSTPFDLEEVQMSLGQIILPVDLFRVAEMGMFSVHSIAVENLPSWRFLAFDLPLPKAGELGPVVRAPISGTVMPGAIEMINGETALIVSIDHPLGSDEILRATLAYTGTIEPLFVIGQEVEAGEALFRLTRDTGRLDTLGNTPIPGGATMTLHVSIDAINRQPSGFEELVFLRGVSLTPAGFLRNKEGLIISPEN